MTKCNQKRQILTIQGQQAGNCDNNMAIMINKNSYESINVLVTISGQYIGNCDTIHPKNYITTYPLIIVMCWNLT